MEFVDYYKILELTRDATVADVKKAYRRLARKYHPDLNPDDKEAQQKFQQINEAHEVLSDPEKRKKYDQYGKDWKHADAFEQAGRTAGPQPQSAPSGGEPFAGTGNFSGGEDFSDFFESLFGNAGGRRAGGGRAPLFRGQDYRAEVHLSLRDALHTHQQTLSVNGKNLRITVPAGISNGQEIKLKGHGGPGIQGGPAGDLYITFVLAPDPVFKRVQSDLFVTKTINLYTAVLGGDETIETLSGKVRVKIKPGTQNGEKIRLKGKGFPVYKQDGKFGDLMVTLQVNIPTDLTAQQKQLFEQLAAS